jgi:hypothetical protein
MRAYTFYLYDGVRPAPNFAFVPCESETNASRHAHLLLDHFPEYEAIEVYDGAAWRVRVTRGANDAAATPPGRLTG